jgi:ATP-binding cassette, subfamily C, bacterial CydC
MSDALARVLAARPRGEKQQVRRAALYAALVAVASVALLALSGWFLTAAALAAGAGTALAFNYMLPSAAIRLFAIVRTGARYGERLASHDAALSAIARVRPALFAALAATPVARALSLSTGAASTRLVQDAGAVETALVLRSGTVGGAAALLSGVALVALAGPLAVLGVMGVAVLLMAVSWALSRQLEDSGRALLREAEWLKAQTAALVEGSAELRCYALEDWAVARIVDGGTALAAAQQRDSDVRAAIEVASPVAIGVGAALALVLAAPHGAAIAALAALAAAMALDGLAPAIRHVTQAHAARAAYARLGALLDEAPPATLPAVSLEPDLVLYGRAMVPPVRIALRGVSGSGKTSLVERLVGLRPAIAGEVSLGGVDITVLPASTLRAAFAWLPQDAALLAGTVRDILVLGRADAPEAAVWEALEDAAFADRVRAMPHGLDSWIGDNGASLSGGERRRLALARAYLKPAPWLLLDEPTEGLDAATAQTVIARLDDRLRRHGQGLLIVSHAPLALVLDGEITPASPPAAADHHSVLFVA